MKPGYNQIPTKLSQDAFDEFIFPYLIEGRRGPKSKIAYCTIFNYILYLLHTGCQWHQLPINKDANGRPEISYTRVFRHFQRWLKLGCFDHFFEASVSRLSKHGLLDYEIMHGDGTTTAAKKGGMLLAIAAIKK
jgi:transposase